MSEALPPVLLVGYGKMGGAMLTGWLARGIDEAIAVDPHASEAPAGLRLLPEPGALPPEFRPAAVVLAVKPQMAAETLPAYARFAKAGAVFVSIMAGQTEAGIERLLGGEAAVVRAMPNTPAAVGQGFTAGFAGARVTGAQKTLADALLRAVGEVAWVEEEAQLDAVTAVSGGGPAYVVLLAELLEKAAVEQGLPADLARRMARATVSGAGSLLARSTAASSSLRAIAAATTRSRELSA